MQPDLPSGIPTLAQYDDLLRTPFFSMIRSAGSVFLEENSEILAQRDHTLMPWKHPLICLLKTLRRGRWPKRWGYTNLTCTCHTFEKAWDE